jgi:guanylate kinase
MGPTGSGKSTFCERLLLDFPNTLRYSVSATSRAPRAQEVPGKSYHFLTREDFSSRITKGEFFEWEEIHGNLYGTLRSTLLEGIESGKDLLFQIDVRGALNFKRTFPDNTVTVFILPPSFQVLKGRLQNRGTVDPEELKRRFATATQEYRALLDLAGQAGKIDYLVVNHEMAEAYEQIKGIVTAERARYLRMDLSSVEQFCEIEES